MPDCHPVCRRAQERGFAKMFSFVQAHPTAVIAGAAAALLLLLAMWLLSRRQTRRLEQRLGALSQQLQEQAQREARETAERERQQREGLRADVRGVNDALVRMMGEMARTQQGQLDSFGGQLRAVNRSDEERMERMQRTVGERLEAYEAQMERITQVLDDKLAGNEERIERVRAALEGGLTLIRRENEQKLEQMRQAVDEKLSGSLDRRLGESFRAVSDRLEQVTRELSQMQTLASGVGDLKRVLTHVNVSGTWSEVRLGALLEQMLAPGQYEACARVNPDGDATADYALLMPGGGEGRVYLPIDASFPQEDYRRYLDAADSGDAGVIEAAQRALEAALRLHARRIRDRLIVPPHTTDYAVLFLPSEGLYAQALRLGALQDQLQSQYRVALAGPTTLCALLNSLQLGFRTLAIERQSAEVWKLLGAVKTEFGRFSELLARTQQKLRAASESIEDAALKTRTIQERLQDVQPLPGAEAREVLPLGRDEDADDEWN